MTHRYTDARAWFERCPTCTEITIEAHADGGIRRLSRVSIPISHAPILGRYREVWNVWISPAQLWVTSWYPSLFQYRIHKPSRGRLYAEHICGYRP